MKNILYIFFIYIFLLHISCQKEITSPLDNINLSSHFLEDFYVTAIDFDSKGSAWIGTFQQGLIKYDGTVTCFDTSNTSLPDSFYIWDIAVDRNDNIWIGSNKGLVKYANDEFIFYTVSNSSMITDNVYALAVDSDNNIWFTSCMLRVGGLIKFNGSNEWTLYTPQNSNLPGSLIGDIISDHQNNIWVTINEGANGGSIVKIYDEEMTLYKEEDIGIELYYFGNLAGGIDGKIYTSIDYSLSSLADDSRPNIISFDNNSWKIENPVDEDNISLGYVSRIGVDFAGNLWAHTSKSGIAVYNGNKWIYSKDDLSIESRVNDISIDLDDNVWFGCGDGIYIIDNP
jgi:ligand-binding sensor domain-containing protein